MSRTPYEWEDRLVALLLRHAAEGEAIHEKLARLVDILEAEEKALGRVTGKAPEKEGEQRYDHRLIEQHIPDGASVLDLGCGAGTLLSRLIQEKRVRGQGVEIDNGKVLECVANGVPVFQTNLDHGLGMFPDQSFDFVVLEKTVQTLNRPLPVLQEMVRVGKQGIVTFPNFGHWQMRLDLALNGRMPVTRAFPYEWYESPNIRPLTLNDFDACVQCQGMRIVEGHAVVGNTVRPLEPDDNLFAEEVMLIIEKAA